MNRIGRPRLLGAILGALLGARLGARRRCVCLALVGSLCAAIATAAEDDSVVIYQWTDSRGIYRYTPDADRIPSEARDTMVTIQTGVGPPSNSPIYFDPDPRSKVIEVPEPIPASATPGSPVISDFFEYDDRIRELEARIAEDEEKLKLLISQPEAADGTPVPPELRDIAERLPRLQAELTSLQRGRARASQP